MRRAMRRGPRRPARRARSAGRTPTSSRPPARAGSTASPTALVGEALGYFVSRDLDAHAGYTRAWHARCLFEQGGWTEAAAEAGRVLAGGPRSPISRLLTARYVAGRIAARRGEDAGEPLDEAGDRRGHRLAAADRARRRRPGRGGLARRGRRPPPRPRRPPTSWRVRAGQPVGGRRAGPVAVAARRGSTRCRRWPPSRTGCRSPATSVAAGQAWQRIGCPYEAADAGRTRPTRTPYGPRWPPSPGSAPGPAGSAPPAGCGSSACARSRAARRPRRRGTRTG